MNKEIKALIDYFENTEIPQGPIALNSYMLIKNPKMFVDEHIKRIKKDPGTHHSMPNVKMLLMFKSKMKNEINNKPLLGPGSCKVKAK